MTKSPAVRAAYLAVAIALVLAGCGGDSEKAAKTTSTTDASGATGGPGNGVQPGDAPVVTLLDAGAEPQKKLRLALVEGAALRGALVLKFGLKLEVDGKPLPSGAIPPIRVDLGATINDIKDNGDAEVGFSYERIDVVDDGTVEKEVIDQVRASGLDKLANLTGKTTVTPRGVAVENSLDIPQDLPPSLKQVVDQLSQQTGSLTVPFPEEAVGNGAKWKVTTSADAGGIRTKLVLTYALRQLEGDQFILDVVYDQTAGRQQAEFPGLPEGTDVELRKLSVKGKGEITGNVAAVFPNRSTLSAAGTVDMDVKSEKEEGKLVQRLNLEVNFETLPAGG